MIETRMATFDSDFHFIMESQIMMAYETEGLKLDPEVVRNGVTAVFQDVNKGAYYVASIDGTRVGCLLTIPEWSDWRNGAVIWIHSVYILETHRRAGVFRAMYHDLKFQVLANPSLRGLRLYVDRNNVSAKSTYQALGMSNEHYELYEWMK